ncbi:MAG: hypothetical protein JWO82_1059 [Akkermansiaceae bacterium]|nr:hypothetical protein [Akkermansiaceae bacterium]
MNPTGAPPSVPSERSTPLRQFLGGLAVLIGALTAEAQPVIAQGASAPLQPAVTRTAAGNQSSLAPAAAENLSLQPSPFKWGSVEFRPSVIDRFSYSDGILTQPGHPANSYINTFSPSFLLDIGSHWTMDYSPSWVIYTNREFHNSLNHSFRLAGAFTSQDWSLQFAQGYAKSSNTLIETARQTKTQSSTTSLSVGYRFTDRLRLDSSNSQDLQFVEAAPDSFVWSTQNWLDYRVSSRLNLALGAGAGYVQVYHSSDSYFLRPGARITLQATDKLSLSLDGGRESRTFLGHGGRSLKSPTMNASLNYQPFKTTTLSFTGGRGVSVSYFAGAVTQTQSWSIALSQRLLQHFVLSADLSGGKTHYEATQQVLIPDITVTDVTDANGNPGQLTTVDFTSSSVIDQRDDAYRAYSFNLSTTLLRHVTIAVFYQASRNSSNVQAYGFSSHQIGAQLGFRF